MDTGSGFDPKVTGGEKLRRLVDPLTPNHPVFVYSADGKMAFANGFASFLARGIGELPDGAIGSMPYMGEPDGMLSGDPMRKVASMVPSDHMKNWPEILETASNYAASLGVTSVQDMHSDELADIYRQLDRAGKLKTRVYDCAPMASLQKLAANGVKAATGDAMVRTGCVKYFSEGDESELPELKRDIAAADKAGLQVMIHAIGPRANRTVLDAFEWTGRLNGRRDRRFRIEHAHGASGNDLPRFAGSGIIASMQPWLFHNRGAKVFKRHLRLRTPLAFGSDASIVDLDPLLGILASASGNDAISIEEAVRACTEGSAFAEFQENVKGTLKVGSLADLVILSDNIFARDFSLSSKVVVLVTIVNGKIVYEFDRPS